MRIGVIVAMEKEYNALQSQIKEGQFAGKEIILKHSGIGKVNAALGAAEMITEHQPDIIVSSGCAGGADVNLEVGDVVVSSSCQYHDVYCGPENLAEQIQGMPSEFPTPQPLVDKAVAVGAVAGKIATGDWFVDSPEKMAAIHKTVPDAKAVDMESCAIAHTCYLKSVPFVSFRVISDIPLKENNTADYQDFWATMADRSFTTTQKFLLSL